jgi:hypothetical protein
MPRGFINKYRCYNFKNKNPVIDKMRTALQDEGLFAKNKRKLLHDLTGVSMSTYDGWFEGETLSPRHETIMATMSAIGYEEQFVKVIKGSIDIEAELADAARWREKQARAREAAEAAGPNGKSKAKRAKVKP